MINYNTEYFKNNLYFFMKDKGDKIHLYYSVADTLAESRKKDEKKEFDKKDEKKIKKLVNKALSSKEKISKKSLDNALDKIGNEDELKELVDFDGTMLSSRIPNLNMGLHPRKTMDQTVATSRVTNDPVTRGYRVYWGESEDKEGDIVNEIDMEDAFGYEETENAKTYDQAEKIMKQMGVEDEEELRDRLNKFGFSKKLDKSLENEKKKGVCKKCFTKRRLTEKDSIEESQKQKMIKMVEDILTKKQTKDSDMIKKDSPISKILEKNLKSIKKLAEKEGVNINQLIKILKTGE